MLNQFDTTIVIESLEDGPLSSQNYNKIIKEVNSYRTFFFVAEKYFPYFIILSFLQVYRQYNMFYRLLNKIKQHFTMYELEQKRIS